MAAFNLAPGIFGAGGQFFGAVGANFPPTLPLNGGILNTFAAGTNTPLATYANNLGSIQNSINIVLGVDGRIPGEIWFPNGVAYKIQLTDSLGFQIQIWDNLVGVNDNSTFTSSEWIASGAVPTFSSATTFTTPGNTTTVFQVGRRVKATVTAGTVYGTIKSSTFAVSTTIILTMDTGMALDSGLNQAQVGLLGETNPSVPMILPYATVAFDVFRNAAQNSGTTVVFDTVTNQSGGTNYATGTGLFTAPFTGWYAFSSSLHYVNSSGGTLPVAATITVNGVTASSCNRSDLVSGTAFICSCSVSAVLMTAGQTASISCTSLAANLVINGGTDCHFAGVLLQRTA